MPARLNDARYMQQALELAARGMALASPNPRVGAVLVSPEGKIVGRGIHTYEGIKHAEILAIEAAGAGTRGATLYLNLEPCSHVGRTGPCADAIIAAVGTIIADDPLLTDRTGLPRRRPLLRVILDSRLRLPLDSRVVKTANYDVIVFCCFAEEHKRQEIEAHGIVVEQVPMRQPLEDGTILFPSGATASNGRPDLERVMGRLGEREITSLIIEGGAMVNWAALSAEIVDKIFFYYAPKIIAGTASIPLALGTGYRRMSEAAYVRSLTLHRFGEDFAVEGYLRDPYADVIHAVPHNSSSARSR